MQVRTVSGFSYITHQHTHEQRNGCTWIGRKSGCIVLEGLYKGIILLVTPNEHDGHRRRRWDLLEDGLQAIKTFADDQHAAGTLALQIRHRRK